MNAIKLLTQDHKKVRQLLSELADTTTDETSERERLVEQIANEVNIHAQIEEEIFYPAFKKAAEESEDEKMFYEAAEEHHVVEMVLPELVQTDPGTEEFSAKAKVLKELIEHHADEEENEMFKRARSLMDDDELEDLGTRLEERKMELGGEELELVGAVAGTSMGGRAKASSRSGNGGSRGGSSPRASSRSAGGNGSRSASGGNGRRGATKASSSRSSSSGRSSSSSRSTSSSRKRK